MRLDKPFEAEVIDTLLAKKNSDSYLVKSGQNAEEIFDELAQHREDLLIKMDALIDRGALLCQESSDSVVGKYLEAVKEKKSQQFALFFEGREMVLKSDNDKIGTMRLAGSQIVQELGKKGVKYRDLSTFLFLELSRTTGT